MRIQWRAVHTLKEEVASLSAWEAQSQRELDEWTEDTEGTSCRQWTLSGSVRHVPAGAAEAVEALRAPGNGGRRNGGWLWVNSLAWQAYPPWTAAGLGADPKGNHVTQMMTSFDGSASRDDRLHGRAADGTGGRGPDRRRARRALGGSYHPPQRLPRPVLGNAGRHGRAEDPEAEDTTDGGREALGDPPTSRGCR